MTESARRARWRRYWDRHSKTYDREMRFFDRVLFGDTRSWVCQQVSGEVLEVAVGTGLNLEHYPPEVRLTGIELSPDMLAIARRRASDLGRQVTLRVGDAEWVTAPLGGEHFRRRPLEHVRAAGLRIERHDRFAAGIVERLAARKPGAVHS